MAQRTIKSAEIDDAFAALEQFERAGGARRRNKRQRGGACTEAQRQRVRIALIATLGTGLYFGGAEALSNAAAAGADGVGELLASAGNKLVNSASCTINPLSGSAVSNLFCTKYAEVVSGLTGLAQAANTNAGLSSLVTFLGGVTIVGAVKTVKDGVIKVATVVKDTAVAAGSGAATTFEKAVDQICATMGPETVDAGVQAAAPSTAREPGQMTLDGFVSSTPSTRQRRGSTPGLGGRRKTRKMRGKKMGKSRRARRATSRTPLFIY